MTGKHSFKWIKIFGGEETVKLLCVAVLKCGCGYQGGSGGAGPEVIFG